MKDCAFEEKLLAGVKRTKKRYSDLAEFGPFKFASGDFEFRSSVFTNVSNTP